MSIRHAWRLDKLDKEVAELRKSLQLAHDRITELSSKLQHTQAQVNAMPVKRGPGRPPKVREDQEHARTN